MTSVEFIIRNPQLSSGIFHQQITKHVVEKGQNHDHHFKDGETETQSQQPQRKPPHTQLPELKTESHSPQVQPSASASLFSSLALGRLPLIGVNWSLKVEGAVVMDTASTGSTLPWWTPALPQ